MSDVVSAKRLCLMKTMYILTIVVAGGLGAVLLILPGSIRWVFGADCPGILSGIIGSVFVAFALVSILGIRDPLRYVPILLMQLLYKSVWLCGVALPGLVSGKADPEILPVVAVFLLIVVGDGFAIPFRDLIRKARTP